jgi:hypothetical protein
MSMIGATAMERLRVFGDWSDEVNDQVQWRLLWLRYESDEVNDPVQWRLLWLRYEDLPC